MLKKYTKKTVEISAVMWNGNYDNLPKQIKNVSKPTKKNNLIIKTLEGNMTCSLGDYIIIDKKGKIYSCKQDIFLEIYDISSNQEEPLDVSSKEKLELNIEQTICFVLDYGIAFETYGEEINSIDGIKNNIIKNIQEGINSIFDNDFETFKMLKNKDDIYDEFTDLIYYENEMTGYIIDFDQPYEIVRYESEFTDGYTFLIKVDFTQKRIESDEEFTIRISKL